MSNMEKLALIKTAYETGINTWSFNEETNELIGYYDLDMYEYFNDNCMLEYTVFYIDYHDGKKFVHCLDKWADGCTMTGICELCEI